MIDWIGEHNGWLGWLTVASVVMFVGSLLALPILAARIPADYFSQPARPPSSWAGRHPLWRIVLFIIKNLLGAVLILAGLAMLVMPGQGLLCMLIGLLLLDLPGKYRLEKRVIARPRILNGINWLRSRTGAPPLDIKSDHE